VRSSDAILKAAAQNARQSTAMLRFAEVVAVSGRTVTVDLDGSELPGIPVAGSYTTPAIGDRAWLMMQGTTLIAIASNTVESGGGGAGAYAYTHTQSVPAALWTITHGLGWMPNATVIDSTGRTVEGDITYLSTTSLTIDFGSAFSGVAHLS